MDFGEKSVLFTNTKNSIQVQDNIEPPADHPRRGWDTLYLIPTCYLFRTMDKLLHTTLEGFSGSGLKAKRRKGLCNEHHMLNCKKWYMIEVKERLIPPHQRKRFLSGPDRLPPPLPHPVLHHPPSRPLSPLPRLGSPPRHFHPPPRPPHRPLHCPHHPPLPPPSPPPLLPPHPPPQ